MLTKGCIKPSVLPYGAPMSFARKKSRELRICIDFRAFNANTSLNGFFPTKDFRLVR